MVLGLRVLIAGKWHMFWSTPIINRRNRGDEVQDGHNEQEMVTAIFGNAAPHRERRIIPVMLAVNLMALFDDVEGLENLFPNLKSLGFNVPGNAPLTTYDEYGNDPNTPPRGPSREPTYDGVSDGDDRSGAYRGSASQGSSSDRTLRSASGTSGAQVTYRGLTFSPVWSGDMKEWPGAVIRLGACFAEGAHGRVHEASLVKDGDKEKEKVVVKISDDNALLAEFDHYQALANSMDDRIPRCFGFGTSVGTFFLVLAHVEAPPLPRIQANLSGPER